jgi:hypothetical protein
MRCVLGLTTTILALALTTEPAFARMITIEAGDTAVVVDSKVVCSASTARGHVRVACFKSAAGKPIEGSIGISIADTGRVAVNRVEGDGSVAGVFQRSPQGAGGVFRVYFGDRFRVAGTPILCDVIRGLATSPPLFRGLKTRCYRTNLRGPVLQSFGVVVSDRFAGVFAFDRFGAPGRDVYIQKQPG